MPTSNRQPFEVLGRCHGCGTNVLGKYFAIWRLPKLTMYLCEFCIEQEWESHNAEWQKAK